MKQRKRRQYFETQANTERYKRSSIPYMQKLLNKEDRDLKNFLSSLCFPYYFELWYLDTFDIFNSMVKAEL